MQLAGSEANLGHVRVSVYQNDLELVWYQLYGKLHTYTSLLQLEKRVTCELQPSTFTNIQSKHRWKLFL